MMTRGSDRSATEPYCHGKDTQEFYNLTQEFYDTIKKDTTVMNKYEVKLVSKVYKSILINIYLL